MCVGRLRLAGESVVVSDPYVIGVDIAGCSTVLQKKCDTGWKIRVPKPFIPYIVVTFWVQIPVMLYLQSKAAYIYA